MKAKSLSVFRTKLRITDEGTVLVTIGQIIEGDEEHLRNLARNRLVELIEDNGESSAKPAKAKADPKAKPAAKPGAAAKPAKAKPESGQGELAQENAEGGTEPQAAPEGEEGKE